MKKNIVQKHYLKETLLISSLFALLSCGGGGEGNSSRNDSNLDTLSAGQSINGNFRDSTVVGLTYSTASEGIQNTKNDGAYNCKVGEDITFSVGNVKLGTTTCRELITPIDLVENSSFTNQEVINTVKFLTLIDEDNNAENGIKITEEVQTLAKNWSVDFNSANNLDEIKVEINENTQVEHTLKTDTEASNHLKSTLMCSYAGAYKGGFSGDDHGGFGVLISPTTGKMIIVGYSEKHEEYFNGSGQNSFTLDSSRSLEGLTSENTLFKGNINTVNSLSGNWSNNGDKGVFAGKRIGGASNAKYRFVGNYSGHQTGLFTFDIDINNNITGVAYNTYEDELVNLTGTITGSSLVAKTSDNLTNITATFDKATGTISSGTWENTEIDKYNGFAYKGTFTGSGCQLNGN